MNQKKKIGLNLINDLCNIINNEEPSAIDTVLACYFLENYSKIGEQNAYDIADACLVSRSSIHRFCHRLGYQSFKDMKIDFKNNASQYDYFVLRAKKDDFSHQYQMEIIKMVADLDELLTPDLLNELVIRIFHSKEVILISSYSEKHQLQKFQRALVLCGKVVHVYIDHFDQDSTKLSFLKKLNANSLTIVISAKGMYARQMDHVIKTIPTYKCLVTTSKRTEFNDTYDKIFYLSKDDYTDLRTIHSEYGVGFFFDILFSIYLKKYGLV